MEKIKERVEIGCYTKMSEMKGISSVKEYIDEAVKRGWKAIGITDFNSTQGFIEAQEYMQQKEIDNLKLIYGIKTKLKDGDDINDIIILVKEQKGLRNLYELASKILTNNSEITKMELDKYREGLLYGINENQKIDKITKYYDFIQIDNMVNKEIIEFANKNNILIIASSNPLFVNKEDKICNEILSYVQGLKICKHDNEKYLYTTEEMLEKFSYLGKQESYEIVVENTNKLADMCEQIYVTVNKASYPKIENSEELLKEKCNEKIREIYGDKVPKEVQERLNLELKLIIINNFEFMYLLASDTVKKANELGYLVRARGCVR